MLRLSRGRRKSPGSHAKNDVRNSECTIHITTRRGRTWTYRRDKDRWTQTSPTGTVRSLTAEQLLSHILPPLAAGKRSHVSVQVVNNKDKGLGKAEVGKS